MTWVEKIYGYEDTPEQDFMRAMENYIISTSNKYWIEGFDADDVAQELRMHLWRRIPKYNPTKGTIETWGYQVVVNRARDLYKKTDPLCKPHCEYDEDLHGTDFSQFV
jgi:RNA polymerase sigma factor (sigma-70 family)